MPHNQTTRSMDNTCFNNSTFEDWSTDDDALLSAMERVNIGMVDHYKEQINLSIFSVAAGGECPVIHYPEMGAKCMYFSSDKSLNEIDKSEKEIYHERRFD